MVIHVTNNKQKKATNGLDCEVGLLLNIFTVPDDDDDDVSFCEPFQ